MLNVRTWVRSQVPATCFIFFLLCRSGASLGQTPTICHHHSTNGSQPLQIQRSSLKEHGALSGQHHVGSSVDWAGWLHGLGDFQEYTPSNFLDRPVLLFYLLFLFLFNYFLNIFIFKTTSNFFIIYLIKITKNTKNPFF